MADKTKDNVTELLSRLKPMERKFVLELRKCGRQGQAARNAGYSEKSADVTASRLMSREDIQEALHALYAQDCKAMCISADSIIVRAIDIYNRCMCAEPVTEFDRDTGEYTEKGEYTFDSRGAAKALDVIVKVAGLDKSTVELESRKDFELVLKVGK